MAANLLQSTCVFRVFRSTCIESSSLHAAQKNKRTQANKHTNEGDKPEEIPLSEKQITVQTVPGVARATGVGRAFTVREIVSGEYGGLKNRGGVPSCVSNRLQHRRSVGEC